MLNSATLANIRRKSVYVDRVQLVNGEPFPSWIDLNVTELCNRSAGSAKACTFCPRIDPALYPNQALHMPLALAEKIGAELRALSYQGVVVLCGFGEPMLHPRLAELAECFAGLRVEIVTNGDRLSALTVKRLAAAGVAFFAVSLYDGPHQVGAMQSIFAEADWPHYILRDRWHTEADDFGLKLTNRGGTIDAGNQPPVDASRPCYYTAYQLTVDWQGDVLLCPQDWHKRVRFGNLHAQSLVEVWGNRAMRKKRAQLIAGRRCEAPCSGCNVDGTMHGANHVSRWLVGDTDAMGLGSNREDRSRKAG